MTGSRSVVERNKTLQLYASLRFGLGGKDVYCLQRSPDSKGSALGHFIAPFVCAAAAVLIGRSIAAFAPAASVGRHGSPRRGAQGLHPSSQESRRRSSPGILPQGTEEAKDLCEKNYTTDMVSKYVL